MQCPWCGYPNLAGVAYCDECGAGMSKLDLPRGSTAIERSLRRDMVDRLNPRPPVCVDRDSSLAEAIARMAEHTIGCVLVVDGRGRLEGILSERDLLTKVAGGNMDLDAAVSSYMTPDPESIGDDQPLAHAIHRMIVGDYRHLPLVDEALRPMGILSSRDIIAFVVSHLGGCADTVDSRETQPA